MLAPLTSSMTQWRAISRAWQVDLSRGNDYYSSWWRPPPLPGSVSMFPLSPTTASLVDPCFPSWLCLSLISGLKKPFLQREDGTYFSPWIPFLAVLFHQPWIMAFIHSTLNPSDCRPPGNWGSHNEGPSVGFTFVYKLTTPSLPPFMLVLFLQRHDLRFHVFSCISLFLSENLDHTIPRSLWPKENSSSSFT